MFTNARALSEQRQHQTPAPSNPASPAVSLPISSVHYVPGVFSPQEVDDILQAASTLPAYQAQVLGSAVDPEQVIRTGAITPLGESASHDLIRERLLVLAAKLNEAAWQFTLSNTLEDTCVVVNYDAARRDFYDWHLDIADVYPGSMRKVSLICGLETAAGGGEFSVLLGPTEYKLQVLPGDVLAFPAFMTSKVYPVRGGTMRALQAFVQGPPFR